MAKTELSSVRLPYFFPLTKACGEAVRHKIKARSKTGVLAEIGNYTIFEGRRTKMRQPDLSIAETELSESSAEIMAKWEELVAINQAYVEKKIDEIAAQFNRSMTENLFKLMHEVTEKTGNVLDAGGPLTNEKMLELQRMMPAFSNPYEEGHLMMVVPPNMMERVAALEEELKKSPDLQKQYYDLKVEKYEEYRSRQLDRELAG